MDEMVRIACYNDERYEWQIANDVNDAYADWHTEAPRELVERYRKAWEEWREVRKALHIYVYSTSKGDGGYD